MKLSIHHLFLTGLLSFILFMTIGLSLFSQKIRAYSPLNGNHQTSLSNSFGQTHSKLSSLEKGDVITMATENSNISTIFYPIFYKNYQDLNTTLYLQNPTNISTTVQFTFRKASDIYSTTTNISAYGMISIKADELVLPDGVYTILISSTQTIHSVIDFSPLGIGDAMVGQLTAHNNQYFGPYFYSSELWVAHNQAETVDLTAEFISSDGLLVSEKHYQIAPYTPFNIAKIDQLPSDFIGVVRVTATLPFVGILNAQHETTYQQYLSTLGSTDTQMTLQHLPRLVNHKSVKDNRVSNLFVTNPTINAVTLQWYLTNIDGLSVFGHNSNLTGLESRFINFGEILDLSVPSIWSIYGSGTGPFLITAWDEAIPVNQSLYASGTYQTDVGTSLYLPLVNAQDDLFSLIYVQNQTDTPSQVTITFYNAQGQYIDVISKTIQPHVSSEFLPTTLSDTSITHGVVSSEQPVQIWVDQIVNNNSISTPTSTPMPSATPAYTPTPTPTTITDTFVMVYHEDFSDPNADPEWVEGSNINNGSCESSYQDGYYHLELNRQNNNSRVTCFRSAPGVAGDNIVNFELPFFYNGAAELSAYHQDGPSNAEIGLYIHGLGSSNLYLLRIWSNPQAEDKKSDLFDYCENGGGWWELRRAVDGDEETIQFKGYKEDDATNNFEKGCDLNIKQGMGEENMNTLKLEYQVEGNLLYAYINGVNVYTFQENEPFKGVGTGVYVRTDTSEDIVIMVDDFKVYTKADSDTPTPPPSTTPSATPVITALTYLPILIR